MPQEEKENLFKHMRFFEALKLYTMMFALKLKFSLRSFEIILIILVLVIGLTTSFHYVKKYFVEQAKGIMENTAMNLSKIEEEMTKSLINASIAIQEMFLRNPKVTRVELIQLANTLGVTTISLFNPDGHFFLTSGKALDKNYELYNFYQEMSVTNTEQCGKQICGDKPCHEGYAVQNCKAIRGMFQETLAHPYKMLSVPMFASMPRKIPSMWVISYNPILDKIFDISYSGIDIIDSNLNVHKGYINYIAITDDEGNLIAETGKADKNAMQISMPYGKKWSFNINGERKYHSYKLKMEFDIAKQVALLRYLFILITIFVVTLIIIIRMRFYDKDKSINEKEKEIAIRDKPYTKFRNN